MVLTAKSLNGSANNLYVVGKDHLNQLFPNWGPGPLRLQDKSDVWQGNLKDRKEEILIVNQLH